MSVYKDSKQILGEQYLDILTGQAKESKAKNVVFSTQREAKTWEKEQLTKLQRCL